MRWRKINNIYQPNGEKKWLNSHAANPFAWPIGNGKLKIYFTSRDIDNRSHISSLIVDAKNKFKVIEVSEKPVLEPGQLGLFDDSGVAMGYMIQVKEACYLYYLGWNLKVTVPWLNTIGLAISTDGGNSFRKFSKAPVMDRSHEDPFSISYPSVLYENGKFRMWYGSNLNWGQKQDDMNHVIKYAESEDGINWKRSGKVCVDLIYESEYALSKPFIIKKEEKYHMWYSYRSSPRGSTYRIGYATSNDGISWNRKDQEAGIDTSSEGWDSEMIEYPFVFDFEDETYMLYNGNGYGKTGFGIAILDD